MWELLDAHKKMTGGKISWLPCGKTRLKRGRQIFYIIAKNLVLAHNIEFGYPWSFIVIEMTKFLHQLRHSWNQQECSINLTVSSKRWETMDILWFIFFFANGPIRHWHRHALKSRCLQSTVAWLSCIMRVSCLSTLEYNQSPSNINCEDNIRIVL